MGLGSSEFALELFRIAFFEELIPRQKGEIANGCQVGNLESTREVHG